MPAATVAAPLHLVGLDSELRNGFIATLPYFVVPTVVCLGLGSKLIGDSNALKG